MLIPPTCVHHRSRHDAVPDRRSHRHPSIIPTRSLVAQGSCVESARTRSSVPAPESCCRSRLGAVQVLVCSIPVSNLSFSSSLVFYFTATHRRFEAHNASHDLSRPDRWWYEVIETFRRLTMTALLLLFKARQHQHHSKPNVLLKIPRDTHQRPCSQNQTLRLAVAFFFSFLSILLHFTTEPYVDPATNTLALVSHLLVFLVRRTWSGVSPHIHENWTPQFCHSPLGQVFFVGEHIAFEVVNTENLGVDIALAAVLLSPPILMTYFMMTQAKVMILCVSGYPRLPTSATSLMRNLNGQPTAQPHRRSKAPRA